MPYACTIMLFILCALCFFLYWFLAKDAYFTEKRIKKAVAQVMQVLPGKDGSVQYQVRFPDEKGIARSALTAHYQENELVRERYNVNIRYVAFHIGKKPVFSVRIKKDGLVRAENYRWLIAVAVLFGAIAVLSLLNPS